MSETRARPSVSGEAGLAPEGTPGCVRCGSCMAVCPLYRLTGREAAVARGKLTLWELFQEGCLHNPIALRDFLEFCLLCGACADKCAVGLAVPDLVKEARAQLSSRAGLRWSPDWFLIRAAWQAPHLIPAAAFLAPVLNRLKNWLGEDSGLLYRLWPEVTLGRFPDLSPRPFRRQAPSRLPGRRSLKIAFFTGCGLEVLFPQAGMAFLQICERLGIEVIIPPGQGCCGLLAESAGERDLSLKQAKDLVQVFAGLGVERVVTACASCSFRLKRLGELLKAEPEAAAAARLAVRVQEASEFLVREVNYRPPSRPRPEGVVYHDPCHLHRGQGITAEPRVLLAAACGGNLQEAAARECCGLGGLFGVSFPPLSRRLGQERLAACQATGAGIVATTCSGCLVQLQRLSPGVPVVHLLELLAEKNEAVGKKDTS